MKRSLCTALLAAAFVAGFGTPAHPQPDPAEADGRSRGGAAEDRQGPRGDAGSRPGGAREGRPGRGGRGAPTREQMAAVLQDIDPALAKRMEAHADRQEANRRASRDGDGRDGRDMRGRDRGDGTEGVRRLFPQIVRLVRLRENDPPMYDLRVRDIRLERDTDRILAEARRIRGDDSIEDADDRLDDLREELEDKVELHFDLRQDIRAAELERMRARIEKLEKDLDRRKDDKDELIAQRIAELRGTSDPW